MAAGTGIGRLALLTTLIVLGTMGCVAQDSEDEAGGPRSSSQPAHRKAHRAEHRPNSDRPPDSTRRPRREPTREEPDEADREQSTEPRGASLPKLWPVTRVVDGDTVEVRYRGRSEAVRVIGIDTPETVHPSEPVECWGPQASAAADHWLEGHRVRLVFESSQGRRDSYDRLLAYVVVPGQGDFGLRMIQAGHAAEYTYDSSYANQAAYQAAERRAHEADRGLWQRCGGIDVPQHAPPDHPASAQPLTGRRCADGYSPCVPPYPPDVDCAGVGGPVRVGGQDPHALDADGDGRACES